MTMRDLRNIVAGIVVFLILMLLLVLYLDPAQEQLMKTIWEDKP